ncbi:MAG TPA: hypothetical protein VJQ56_11805 [Blastocatellia bacterium]|nr:hypothetical protein [Blastocatellia bacterium]
MTDEEVERAIQFLIEHHAKVSAKIDDLNQTVSILASQAEADRAETREAISQLSAIIGATRMDMQEAVSALIANSDADRIEIRAAIENLIVANEVTRDLAEKVARLAIETSHRVTKLESEP